MASRKRQRSQEHLDRSFSSPALNDVPRKLRLAGAPLCAAYYANTALPQNCRPNATSPRTPSTDEHTIDFPDPTVKLWTEFDIMSFINNYKDAEGDVIRAFPHDVPVGDVYARNAHLVFVACAFCGERTHPLIDALLLGPAFKHAVVQEAVLDWSNLSPGPLFPASGVFLKAITHGPKTSLVSLVNLVCQVSSSVYPLVGLINTAQPDLSVCATDILCPLHVLFTSLKDHVLKHMYASADADVAKINALLSMPSEICPDINDTIAGETPIHRLFSDHHDEYNFHLLVKYCDMCVGKITTVIQKGLEDHFGMTYARVRRGYAAYSSQRDSLNASTVKYMRTDGKEKVYKTDAAWFVTERMLPYLSIAAAPLFPQDDEFKAYIGELHPHARNEAFKLTLMRVAKLFEPDKFVAFVDSFPVSITLSRRDVTELLTMNFNSLDQAYDDNSLDPISYKSWTGLAITTTNKNISFFVPSTVAGVNVIWLIRKRVDFLGEACVEKVCDLMSDRGVPTPEGPIDV